MKHSGLIGRLAAAGSTIALAFAIAGSAGAQPAPTPTPAPEPQPGDIALAPGLQPESIAATPDGGLIIGTTAGTIFRWMPGQDQATQWVTGLVQTFGVFAKDDTAYMCATNAPNSAVVTYQLSSASPAVPTGAYDFPGGGTCNDFAIGDDGTLYVTDTTNGRVLYLAPDRRGNMTLQTLIQSTAISGVDGIAILNGAIYVNDVRASTIWRIDVDAANKVTAFTQINLDTPINRPDGMRTTEDGTGLYVAENAGHQIDLITIDGDNGHVTKIADGFTASTGIAQIGTDGYVVGTIRNADPTVVTYVHKIDLNP